MNLNCQTVQIQMSDCESKMIILVYILSNLTKFDGLVLYYKNNKGELVMNNTERTILLDVKTLQQLRWA